MDILLEDAILTSISNTCKNGRDTCDYNCGQKFMNDRFLEPKLNVCKANCDLIWSVRLVKELQEYLTKTPGLNVDIVHNVRNRIETAKKRVMTSRNRLIKTKMTLKKVLYGRRADMSMRPVKTGPAFER